MGLFSQKECQSCNNLQDQVDILTARNQRLEKALRELRHQYDVMQKENNTEVQIIEGITQKEVDELFQRIKSSDYDKDKKRYFRSMLMMIKGSYNPSIHKYLLEELT